MANCSGGYTALSTKGVSSMLSSTLLGAFTTPVTYALVFVLLFTAIMQVRYVNKALQRFDSTQVIPIQFVLFTLSVIIGSAVLYRDFERTTSEQAIKFVGGCLFTFFGVFLITSGRPRQDDEDEVTLSDAEGIEETIGLAEQDRMPPPTPPRRRHSHTPARSRRSSRTSRVSFSDAVHRPVTASDAGIPSSRVPTGALSQKSLLDHDDDDEDDREDAPLLSNPWQITNTPPARPSPGPHTTSADSVPSAVPSTPISDSLLPALSEGGGTQQHTATTVTTTPKSTPSIATTTPKTAAATTPPRISLLERSERPATPRASASTSRIPTLASQVYSPSPFSSTLSAVVGDKLLLSLRQGDGHNHSSSSSPTPGSGQGAQLQNGSGTARRNRAAAGLVVALPGDDGFSQGQGQGLVGQERGSVSALEPAFGSRDGDGNGSGGTAESGGGGFRGRARSLSHTLGLAGLFGGTGSTRRATLTRRDTDQGDADGQGGAVFGGWLERARTAGDGERNGNGSGSREAL